MNELFVQKEMAADVSGCANAHTHTNAQMQGSQDRVAECTTSNFDGMISMLRPEESWVAKWQRIGEFRWSP